MLPDFLHEELRAKTKMTSEQTEHFLSLRTWSARIRLLVSVEMPDAEIAKLLRKRQQHVRSVRLKPSIKPREV